MKKDMYQMEMEKQLADTGRAENPAIDKTNEIDDTAAQATSKPSDDTAQSEVAQLREQIAQLEAAAVRGKEPEEKSEDLSLYSDQAQRDELAADLGDDLLEAQEKAFKVFFQNASAPKDKKLNALEQYKADQEKSETSAAFIRAVGNDTLKTFNSEAFQAFAKGEKLGRKTLLDELKDIADTSDVEGADVFMTAINGFNESAKAVRKASVNAGRSPVVGQSKPEAFDTDKAKSLEAATRKYPVGSENYIKAVQAFKAYMQTNIQKV